MSAPAEDISNIGATITFHDLSYQVQVGKCCKKITKEILHNVNGIFKPGLNAILGPTGSGKTSLLDTLAGRKDPKGVSGTILVNGKPQPKNFKCMTGYVVQDDIVMGTLSVRENFMFSANLRMGNDVSMKEKKAKVESTLEELGMTHIADSKIGTAFIRGVSGGERKRTNIGMELIFSPPVLFLDEPTTGLDASTAGAVLQLLKDLSLKGRTIVFSIHQPRYAIFKLFDQLMLVSRGHMVFHGPSHDALEYFSSIGYECEPHDNPADFFLDVINGDSTAIRESDKKIKTGLATQSSVVSNAEMTEEQLKELTEQVTNELKKDYKESKWWTEVSNELVPILNAYQDQVDNKTLERTETVSYATNVFTQIRYVSKRQVTNSLRSPQSTILTVVLNLFLGLIIGLLYYDIDSDSSIETKIQNRMGFFFFVTTMQVFVAFPSLELFVAERGTFIHENVSGFYRVSSYFFAKISCDLIPLRILPVVAFSVIAYFMTGLTTDAGKFFVFVLDLLLLSATAASACFFVSSGTRIYAIAQICVAMMFISMMIFGGLFANLDSIVVWLRWLQYFSFFKYSLNSLAVNELDGLILTGDGNRTMSGNEVLDQFAIPNGTRWDLWQNIVALMLMSAGFLTLTYIRLRTVNKYK